MGLFDFRKKRADFKFEIEIKVVDDGEECTSNLSAPHEVDKRICWTIDHSEIIDREIKPIEDAMIATAVALKKEADDIDARVEKLTIIVDYFYRLKSKCNSIDGAYENYFSRMWEHCHNSHNPDFCYIERFEKELTELQENYDDLKRQEILRQITVENLKQRIVDVLRDNQSILQTDLYKMIDPNAKEDLRSILYFMARSGRITRKKSGSTYEIRLEK